MASTYSVFNQKKYAAFFASSVVSYIGNSCFIVCIYGYLSSIGSSPFIISVIYAISVFPSIFLTFLGGRLTIAYGWATVIAYCSICGSLISLLIIEGRQLFLHSSTPILLGCLAISCAGALSNTAFQCAYRDLVDESKVDAAVIMNSLGFHASGIVGPIIGYWVARLISYDAVALLNSLSFVPIAIFALRIYRRRVIQPRTGAQIIESPQASKQFVSYFLRLGPSLRMLSFCFALSALLAIMPVMQSDPSLDGTRFPFYLSCYGIGRFLGGMIMPRIRHRASDNLIQSTAALLCGLIFMSIPMFSSFYAISFAILTCGVFCSASLSTTNIWVQTINDPTLRNRCIVVYNASFNIALSGGGLFWGICTRSLQNSWLFWLSGCVLVLTSCCFYNTSFSGLVDDLVDNT